MSEEVDYTLEPTGPVSFQRKSRNNQAEMDITPMIDITFLLLIFFLVASRLSQEAFVELPRAKYGQSVSSENAVIVTVTQGTGENADIYKSDGVEPTAKLASTDLEDQQVELSEYIKSALDGGMTQVIIKAENGVRHRDVARVAKSAGEATAEVLYVAVIEEAQ